MSETNVGGGGFLVPPYLSDFLVTTYGSYAQVSRALLEDDATPEEREERRRIHAEKQAAAWALNDAARPALAAITDPLARAILDLHSPSSDEHPQCDGCDYQGYEADPIDWPCATVELVAERFGIELPDSSYLWRRPGNDPEPPPPTDGFAAAFFAKAAAEYDKGARP